MIDLKHSLLPGLSAIQNIHPMFVHFPIAFFLGALAMELAANFVHERFHFVATWMLYLAALSAVVTATTGFLAMNQIAAASGGHHAPGHELIHVHQNWMVSVTTIGVLLSIYLFWINKKGKWISHRWRFLGGLLLLSMLLTLGADRGARLVYEFGRGVNPEVLKAPTEGSEHGNEHGGGH
jgi:uncharacterized membrane protein